MPALRDFSEDTALFPWQKSTPYPAIPAALAVALALVLGELTGHQAAGSIAAGAAFTIGFAVFHEALSSTLLSMAFVTLGIASATLIGSLSAGHTSLVLLVCLLAALNYGLLTSLDAYTTWMGQQCGVYVIITSYFSQGTRYALGRTGMVLAGGALQMFIYFVVERFPSRGLAGDPTVPPLLPQIHARARQLWALFRQELQWNRAGTNYVVRLVLTLGLTTALYRSLHWRNGYWAPMTAMLVLKPKWANTLSRGIARLVGTLAGAAAAALLTRLHPGSPYPHWFLFLLVILTAYACFALQAVNYAAFSTALTLYVIFLFGFGGFSERTAGILRLANTAIGGTLALLVDWLFTRFGVPFSPGPPAASPTQTRNASA